jgi:hypothetical protein
MMPIITTKGTIMRYALSALLVIAGTSALAQTAPAQQVMQAAPAAAGFGLSKVFDEADTNRDNVVTKAEFLAKAERHFGMADANKDGQITREEMQAQQAAFTQQMQQNLFGKGGNWQGKLNEFLGNGAAPGNFAAPTTPVVTSPAAPMVTRPTAPTMH